MSFKDSLHRIELLLAVGLLIVLISVFSVGKLDLSESIGLPEITGFVSSDPIIQNLDLEIEQSQKFQLSTEDSFKLTSFRLDGSVEGEGYSVLLRFLASLIF